MPRAVGILTSDKGVSLQRVAKDVGRVLKAETGATIYVFLGHNYQIFELPDDSSFVVVMTFEPALALSYFFIAWELQKRYGRLAFYTTIEGRINPMQIPNWIARDLSFIANSRYTAERLREAGVKVIDTVYHGVDIEAVQSAKPKAQMARRRIGVGESDFLIGYIAGCYMRKGHDLFAEALKVLREKDPSIKAVILTQKECAQYYEPLENAIPLIDFGRLRDEDVWSIYHALDLYVQPSLSEGFGLPVLEALAAGKLVVHPDYDPLSEITTPETSVRVPVTDVAFKREVGSIEYELHFYDPNEMAEAILYAKDLLQKNRDEVESKCIERAKEFDYSKVYKRFVKYIV